MCDVIVTLVSLQRERGENKDRDKGQKGRTIVLRKEVVL